jgi:mannose-6-phosphate isomerase-like protein (cupin superfamily)
MSLRLIDPAGLQPAVPPGHWGMSARTLAEHGGRLRVQLCEMEAAGGADAHVHADLDQVFLVLTGGLEVTDGEGAAVSVAAGQAVHVPAGTPHATVPAGGPTTYFVLTFPADAA